MAKLQDRVQETTTTVGTGTFALNGAVTGYITFNSGFINGDIVWYVCDDGAGNWEIGYGTVGTGTLTRTAFQSSNSNNLVSFAAGAKRVFCTAPYTYLLPDQTGQDGKILTTASGVPSWTTVASAGGVTAVSVTSANGFAGTSSGGSTPALTLSTTVTGVLKGNGTAISAATAGTDYLAPPSGTSILKANSGGALANAVAGTDYAPATSGTSILKGNGAGGFSNAVGNTDYLAVNNPIATGVLKLNGSSSGYVGLQGAAAAGSTTYTLPSADGSNGQVLSTNGTGTLAWTTAATTITISNDTSTATNVYPAFLSATTGTAATLYTGNARLLYLPSTGQFQSTTFRSGNGLFVNSATVSENCTIASGDNASSAGPITVASGVVVTVSSNSVWTVV